MSLNFTFDFLGLSCNLWWNKGKVNKSMPQDSNLYRCFQTGTFPYEDCRRRQCVSDLFTTASGKCPEYSGQRWSLGRACRRHHITTAVNPYFQELLNLVFPNSCLLWHLVSVWLLLFILRCFLSPRDLWPGERQEAFWKMSGATAPTPLFGVWLGFNLLLCWWGACGFDLCVCELG